MFSSNVSRNTLFASLAFAVLVGSTSSASASAAIRGDVVVDVRGDNGQVLMVANSQTRDEMRRKRKRADGGAPRKKAKANNTQKKAAAKKAAEAKRKAEAQRQAEAQQKARKKQRDRVLSFDDSRRSLDRFHGDGFSDWGRGGRSFSFSYGNRGARFDRPRRKCNLRKAVRKAKRMGLRRAHVVRANPRRVVVAGREFGDRVVIGFGRARSCPIHFVRYR